MNIDAVNFVKISELANVTAGFPFREAIRDEPNGDTPVVQMRNTTAASGVDWPSAVRVKLPPKKPPRWLEDGDVLFAARGANNYALHVERPPERAVCSPHFFVLSAINRAHALPAFVAWQINQAPAQKQLDAVATGSHIRNIRRQALQSLCIALPSIDHQSAIIAFANAAHGERALFERLALNRQQQLDALALGLFMKRGVQDNER
ncbi:restriction endonuclease subunit S [Thalassospira sp.]|uniref:restriction endonuclease subunit S n=1 Tax=Thalassospira sp. TaxID=1912094 RepID=UPI0032EADD05